MDVSRLDYLLNRYVDEGLLVDEKQELESLLFRSAEARDSFWTKILFHGLIRDYYDELSVRRDLATAWKCSNENSECVSMPELATMEPMSPAADASVSSCSAGSATFPLIGVIGNAWHGTIGFFSQEVPFALLVATIITAFGLWGSSLIYVNQPQSIAKSGRLPAPAATHSLSPAEQYVARITGMANCKGRMKGLGTRDQSLETSQNQKSLVALGDKLILSAGLLEIAYDTGAKVILQGPVTYEVDSPDGGFLSIGKLTARLDKKRSEVRDQGAGKVVSGQWPEKVVSGQWSVASETNPEIPKSPIFNPQSFTSAFTVKTPTATVTDLGTEFGVEVDPQGITTSYVYRGTVQVQAVSLDGRPEGNVRTLHQNEAARVNVARSQRTIVFVPFDKPQNFVRAIPEKATKTLDLVDILAGGDGSSQRRSRGINPTNGQPTDQPPPPDKFFLEGDKNYHRVAGHSLVDGVFVPADNEHPSQIDSAGHTFPDWFEPTCNQTYGYIWAGGKIPSSPGAHLRAVLDGIDYSESIHGSIFLHANSGVTFDLAAIRKAHPSFRIAKFVAKTGNAESSSATLGDAGADVWVFVDGKVQFRRRQINYMNGAFAVDLPIAKTDRFLTLVSSDGNHSIGWDWIVFGDPRLELIEDNSVSNDMPTTPTEAAVAPRKP